MTMLTRALAVVAALCLLAGPALADASFPLTTSWQKVASAGATVDVQNTSSQPVMLITSGAVPTAGLIGQTLAPGDHRPYTLTADLYAVGSSNLGNLVVTSGIAAPSGGGGSGSSGNITQFGGSALVTGTGASGAGIPRFTIANDSAIITYNGNLGGAATEASVLGAKLDLDIIAAGVQQTGGFVTQTRVTLPAGTSARLIPYNPSRRCLIWQNTGTNPMTVSPVSPAVAGVGMNYDPGSSSSNQGGSRDWQTPPPTNDFYAISTNGTSVTVWECN